MYHIIFFYNFSPFIKIITFQQKQIKKKQIKSESTSEGK